MAIPRNLANLANQLNTDGEVPKIEVGDSKVEVTDTGSNGKITGTADGTAVFSVEKGKTFVLQGGASSTGVGIAFPADQTTVGASTDANTLDDYEEGTWTPILADAATGGNTAVSYTANVGAYTKIGRLVTVSIFITFPDTTGMTGGNTLYIRGLPFTVINDDRGNAPGTAPVFRDITFAAGQTYCVCSPITNSTNVILKQNGSNSVGSDTIVSQIASNAFLMRAMLTYIV